MLKMVIAASASLVLAPISVSGAASPGVSRAEACGPWMGKYFGKLAKEQVFFGEAETVFVMIDRDGISLELQGADRGAFEASSGKMKCGTNLLRSRLDDGWGGKGAITLRKVGPKVYLKIFGFSSGKGPDKAGYLPLKATEIEIRK